MGKIDFSSPLPEKKLIQRFREPFKKLTTGQSCTILSFPQLGHTSHLRYLNSDKKILEKLGVTKELFVFIDRDKVISGYESFASELLIGLDHKNIDSSAINSQNAYILNKEIIHQTCKITKESPIIIALVVEKKLKEHLSEIENLLLLMQKSTKTYPISILWIADTKTAREHISTHPSSSFLTNTIYQKNFDKEETDYCLQRIASLRGKKVSKDILLNSLKLTGGFACTFHHFMNTGEIISSDYVKNSLLEIKKEVLLNNSLVTKEGLSFLNNLDISEVRFENIKLKSNPTAQEVNLLRFFQKNIDKPVSRDEIATCIWGKSWNTKYSDWAIDKAVSRLRKNILSENYKVITVKNLGYELIKL